MVLEGEPKSSNNFFPIGIGTPPEIGTYFFDFPINSGGDSKAGHGIGGNGLNYSFKKNISAPFGEEFVLLPIYFLGYPIS